MINVFITDDHKSYIEGIKAYLTNHKDIGVVGFALNGKQAVESIKKTKIDVMTLDIDMPGMNGEQTLKEIKQINPAVKILIPTSLNDKAIIESVRKYGADGFRNKDAGMDDIIRAIRSLHAGYTDFLTRNEEKPNRVTLNYSKLKLTGQEKRVVSYLSEGHTLKSIAGLMHLSEHTIESHSKTARAKAGAKNVAELVAKAIKQGLI